MTQYKYVRFVVGTADSLHEMSEGINALVAEGWTPTQYITGNESAVDHASAPLSQTISVVLTRETATSLTNWERVALQLGETVLQLIGCLDTAADALKDLERAQQREDAVDERRAIVSLRNATDIYGRFTVPTITNAEVNQLEALGLHVDALSLRVAENQ